MSTSPDPALSDAIKGGHYAQKQIYCKSRIIAWSHTARFEMARRLLAPHAGGRLLDYGCGDGTFLALARELFSELLGADISPKQTIEAQNRLGDHKIRFCTTAQLATDPGGYDAVTCMETLEHVVENDIPAVLSDLVRLVKPGGPVLISVPIEIGPTLLAKQILRRVAGWRRLGDYAYTERYAWGELAKMTFATADTAIKREPYSNDFGDGRTVQCYGHKGFNWRALRQRIGEQLIVRNTVFSPVNWSRGFLSSQAWFTCESK